MQKNTVGTVGKTKQNKKCPLSIMRKTKLTPLQNRIIWILEEAGEESMATVRATLHSQGEQDEDAIQTALDGLRLLDFVSLSGSSASLTEAGYAALTK